MKPYASYKPSGVPWLGDVPNHWISAKLKFRLERNDGGAWGADPEGMNDTMVLRSTEQTVDGRWKLEDPAYRKLSLAEAEATLLVEGDLLVTKSSGSETHIGKTSLVDADVAGLRAGYSNFMQRLRVVSEAVPKYVWYLLNSDTTKTQVNILASTTTGLANLNAGVLGRLVLAYPPAEEQQAIADHLDVETARIDTLIDEKDELIGLLQEWRQSMLTEAVTKGLDKTVIMKPSGVPWLGEVPEHWRVEKVKFQARLRGEKSVGTNGARYVGMEHVLSKVGKFNPVVEGSQEEAESTVNVFSKGDVLFGKLRPYLAKCVVADTDGVCSSEFLVLSPSDGVVPAYLNATMLMDEFIDAVDASTFGAKMPRADWGFIGQQRLPLPPPDEQQAIADYLDAETAKIDDLIAHTNDEIALLKELRAATIADAVLGRVDVRTKT